MSKSNFKPNSLIMCGWDIEEHREMMKQRMKDQGWTFDDVKIIKRNDGSLEMISKKYL